MSLCGEKWVSPPYNVDGWRLDVAADLGHSNEFNHHFWKDFRKAVKEANPGCTDSCRALRRSRTGCRETSGILS